ncbi:hypothetical protein AB0O07_19415 [Streptomyces sp. NPDC093085]|uniref:hypothetical protein n=1 Tax=Streptomyces sp. NPDC093085 TaxID=3155068 RepID=UPI0034426D3F
MPAPSITITSEFSGSVVAKGATDDLSASLLKHAGFQQIDDWYGRRHRLPTTIPIADKVAIATHAAEMLRAARYSVDLAPSLDTARMSTPAHPLGPYAAGAELLQITDRIRAAENGPDLRRAVEHLLHPEHGALERVREALEAAGEQINGLDNEAYALADRFDTASEFVISAQSELVDSDAELRQVGKVQQPPVATRAPSARLADPAGVALATSPAAAKAKVSPAHGDEAAHPSAGRMPAAHPWSAAVIPPPAAPPMTGRR